ncbi:MAG: hypothetical protein ACXIUQ_07200 [Cecembia sp.]
MGTSFARTEYVQPYGVTKEADVLRLNLSNALFDFVGNSISVAKKMEEDQFREFLKLKDIWKQETLFQSSGTAVISNSSYRKIIGLGETVLPWIIRELRRNDDHWFYALEKITGKNPIKKENVGNINKMKEDWLDWANKNNI